MEEHPYTDLTLAYLAGLIDGEGSIGIVMKRYPQPHRHPTHYPILNVANTHQPTIEWLHNLFGCGGLYSPQPKSIWHKPIWIWHAQSNDAGRILHMVFPYLRIKQAQARIALDFYEYHRFHLRKVTDDVVRQNEAFRQAIRDLNQQTRSIEQYPIPETIMLTPVDLAYCAAFFDGEGSVRVFARKSREKGGQGMPLYGLQVSMGNTDYPMLLWLQTAFAGNLSPWQVASKKKQVWGWMLHGDAAQSYLKAIFPFVRIKQEQVRLAIEFQDYHRAHWQSQLIHCTPEVFAKKEEYRQRIGALGLYNRTRKYMEWRQNT